MQEDSLHPKSEDDKSQIVRKKTARKLSESNDEKLLKTNELNDMLDDCQVITLSEESSGNKSVIYKQILEKIH